MVTYANQEVITMLKKRGYRFRLSLLRPQPHPLHILAVSVIEPICLPPQDHAVLGPYTLGDPALYEVCDGLGNLQLDHLVEREFPEVFRRHISIFVVVVGCVLPVDPCLSRLLDELEGQLGHVGVISLLRLPEGSNS